MENLKGDDENSSTFIHGDYNQFQKTCLNACLCFRVLATRVFQYKILPSSASKEDFVGDFQLGYAFSVKAECCKTFV